MNFRHDFAEMAREEFRNLGMSVPKEWDDYEICIKLFQVLQRHINSNIPYYVLYSKELLQKLPYLPESDRREIKRIEWCLRNCQSITEYMSRDINTTSMRKSDFMLKNWEIYHVHLEKVQKNKKCTNPHLLFFQIKGQVAHFIDVKKHPQGSDWFDRDLLEIVYQNWPNLLVYPNGLRPCENLPDNQIYELTKRCVAFIPFHEGVLFPTSMGVMSSGDSGTAVRAIQFIFNSFALWEKQLEKDEKRLRTEINRIHHPMPEKLDFSLIIEKNNFVAYEEYAQIKVKMFVVPLLLQSAK